MESLATCAISGTSLTCSFFKLLTCIVHANTIIIHCFFTSDGVPGWAEFMDKKERVTGLM